MRLEKSILLSGLPATGKSTVGRLAAAKAEVPFVDLDSAIEAEAGMCVPEIFATRGEPLFREIEAKVLRALLHDGVVRVVALGGGALVPRALRHEALDVATIVTLDAPIPTLLERARPLESRPLLAAGDAHATLVRLRELRAEAYAETHATLPTDDRDLDGLADAALATGQRAPGLMPLGRRSYAIDVVDDAPERLTDVLAALAPSKLVFVSDSNVERARGAALRPVRRSLAIPAVDVVLPPGEENKNLAAVSTLWDAALGSGIDRDAVVVAFGGGVVGDLAGFVAATLLRGLRCVQVPTTLLAMVDSSVGGKTGFDSHAGKNLIGAFHQPAAVVADVAHLTTLPPRHRAAGLAEVVKIALCTDASLFVACEEHAAALASGDSAILRSIVRRAIAAKARVVRDDEFEQGRRALLNAGHTAGHGLEAAGGYTRWLHGEAVAAGLVFELRWLAERGLASAELASRTEALLVALGLPVRATTTEWAQAAAFIAADKKRRGRSLVIPTAKILGAGALERVPLADFEAGLRGA